MSIGHRACNEPSAAGNPEVLLSIIPPIDGQEAFMGRYLLLWLLGVPIPILLLIWAFGGLS
jgi:hypothetical protein